jgi:hypothetical protein
MARRYRDEKPEVEFVFALTAVGHSGVLPENFRTGSYFFRAKLGRNPDALVMERPRFEKSLDPSESPFFFKTLDTDQKLGRVRSDL